MDTFKNQRVKRTQRDYTMAFKLSVVSQVEKGEMTYRQAQAMSELAGNLAFYNPCNHSKNFSPHKDAFKFFADESNHPRLNAP